jgi:hypothetical protein
MRWRHALLALLFGWVLPVGAAVGTLVAARSALESGPWFIAGLLGLLVVVATCSVVGPSTIYRALGIAELTRATPGPRPGLPRALASALRVALVHTARGSPRVLRGAWTSAVTLTLLVGAFVTLLWLQTAAVLEWVPRWYQGPAMVGAFLFTLLGTYAVHLAPRTLRRAAVRRLARRLEGARVRRTAAGVQVEGTLEGRRCVVQHITIDGEETLSAEVALGARAVAFTLERAELVERVARRLGRALAGEREERVEDRLLGGDRALAAGHSSEALAGLAGLLERHDLDRVVVARDGRLSVAAAGRTLLGVRPAALLALLRDLAALAPLFERTTVRVREREAFGFTRAGGALMCPFCRDALEATRAVACEGCATLHHDECLREAGGCTVFGCDAAPAPRERGPDERVKDG